jgi:hypothetical protein
MAPANDHGGEDLERLRANMTVTIINGNVRFVPAFHFTNKMSSNLARPKLLVELQITSINFM